MKFVSQSIQNCSQCMPLLNKATHHIEINPSIESRDNCGKIWRAGMIRPFQFDGKLEENYEK